MYFKQIKENFLQRFNKHIVVYQNNGICICILFDLLLLSKIIFDKRV